MKIRSRWKEVALVSVLLAALTAGAADLNVQGNLNATGTVNATSGTFSNLSVTGSVSAAAMSLGGQSLSNWPSAVWLPAFSVIVTQNITQLSIAVPAFSVLRITGSVESPDGGLTVNMTVNNATSYSGGGSGNPVGSSRAGNQANGGIMDVILYKPAGQYLNDLAFTSAGVNAHWDNANQTTVCTNIILTLGNGTHSFTNTWIKGVYQP